MHDTLLESKRVTVLDLLDRLLETGVVVDGEVDLSVADIDLIHLGLKMVLASSATLEQHSNGHAARLIDPAPSSASGPQKTGLLPYSSGTSSLTWSDDARRGGVDPPDDPQTLPASSPEVPGNPKVNFEPAKVEQGLAKLVLILVELIRRLMEKQAIRKMEGGRLTDAQLERLGEAFRRLESKMVELKRVFGLEDDDLNLDLGPLGQLM